MAQTYNDESYVRISKFRLGENYYYLKDAAVRAILDTYTSLPTYSVATSISDSSSSVPTTAAIKGYVDAQVGAIKNFSYEIVATLPTASAETMYTIYLLSNSGASPNSYDEYLTVQSGSSYSWEKIGTTAIDLTDYVTRDELGDLAYKDSASGTISTADSISGASYTPAGSVTTTSIGHTSTKLTSTGSFTPEGSVTGSVTATGNVTATANANGSFQPGGTVSAPTITVTPSTTNVYSITGVGTLPSFTEGAFTPPSLTYNNGNFATSGVTATVDTETETLVLGSATTAKVITAWSAGSKASDTWSAGSLPTRGSAVSVMTGASASASAPTFTGSKYNLGFSGTSATINASFTGEAGSVSVSGNYDKATSATNSFSGTAATITPTLVKTNKTVTVS